jgi:hypothetical protein
VNSIRDEIVAFDTNVFLFALRKHPSYPACEMLVFDKLSELKVYFPLQVFVELERNLHNDEMRGLLRALLRAKTVTDLGLRSAANGTHRTLGTAGCKERRCGHSRSP